MFNRIRSLHRIGYVHRDIKLNNFVITLPNDNKADNSGSKLKLDLNPIINQGNIEKEKDEGPDDLTINLIDYGITKKVEDAELLHKIE